MKTLAAIFLFIGSVIPLSHVYACQPKTKIVYKLAEQLLVRFNSAVIVNPSLRPSAIQISKRKSDLIQLVDHQDLLSNSEICDKRNSEVVLAFKVLTLVARQLQIADQGGTIVPTILGGISTLAEPNDFNFESLKSPLPATSINGLEQFPQARIEAGSYTEELLNGKVPGEMFAAYDEAKDLRKTMRTQFYDVVRNLPINPRNGMIEIRLQTGSTSYYDGAGYTSKSAHQQTSDGLRQAIAKAFNPATGLQVGGIDTYKGSYFTSDDKISHTVTTAGTYNGMVAYVIVDPQAEIKIEVIKAQSFRDVVMARDAARKAYMQSQIAHSALYQQAVQAEQGNILDAQALQQLLGKPGATLTIESARVQLKK